MILEDGKGSGRQAEVNSSNQLTVKATSEPADKFSNRSGKVWSVLASTTPVGVNDIIFYFKNTGTETYVVTDIRASAAGASTLDIITVTGTPTFTSGGGNGVALTPVNRNLSRSDAMTATIIEDTDTTGLTENGVLFFIECLTANELYHLRTTSNIIIPPGQAIVLKTDGTTAVRSLWSFSVLD